MASKRMKRRTRRSCKYGKLKRPVRTKKRGKRRCRKSKRRKSRRKNKRKSYKMDYQGPRGLAQVVVVDEKTTIRPEDIRLTKIKSYMDNLPNRDTFCDTVSRKIEQQYAQRAQRSRNGINIVNLFMTKYERYSKDSMYRFLILLFIPFESSAKLAKTHDYLTRLVALIDECVKENVLVIELEVRASVLTQFLYDPITPPNNEFIASMLNESFFAEAMRQSDSKHFYINGAVPKSADVFKISLDGTRVISYELKRTLHNNAIKKFKALERTNDNYGRPLVDELVSVELSGADNPFDFSDTPTIKYKIFNHAIKEIHTQISVKIPSYEFLFPIIKIAMEKPYLTTEDNTYLPTFRQRERLGEERTHTYRWFFYKREYK